MAPKPKMGPGSGRSKIKGTPEYKRRQQRVKKRAAAAAEKPYKDALKVALDALAPQLTAGRQEANTLDQHAAQGGGIDQAHDRYAGHVDRTVQSSNYILARPPAAPTGPQTTQPSAAAAINPEAQKFGMTGKAAEVTAQTEAQADSYLTSIQQQQSAASSQALGNFGLALAGLKAAGEFRREDSRTRTRGAATQAREKVAGLESTARSTARGAVAESEQQDFANRLAERSLGLEADELALDRRKERNDVANEKRDDRRDAWKAKLTDRQKRWNAQLAARLKREGMSQAAAQKEADRRSREQIARDNRRARETSAATGGKGDAKLHVGRAGTPVAVTPGERKKAILNRDKIVSYRDEAKTNSASGKAGKPPSDNAAAVGWYWANGGKIPRKYIPYLKRTFPQGIPANIHRAIADR